MATYRGLGRPMKVIFYPWMVELITKHRNVDCRSSWKGLETLANELCVCKETLAKYLHQKGLPLKLPPSQSKVAIDCRKRRAKKKLLADKCKELPKELTDSKKERTNVPPMLYETIEYQPDRSDLYS